MSFAAQALPYAFPAPDGPVEVLIVAGEHSGDQQAARMVAEFRAGRPEGGVYALGGPALAAAGVPVIHDLTASSVVGLVEVLKHYGYFRRVFEATLRWIEAHRPRVVCLVDYPGFNLRLAAALKKRGISCRGGGAVRVVQYISPQIWAWKSGRRFAMAELLDALAVIFPFEVECYKDTALPVEFVGHPFVAGDYVNPLRRVADGPVLLLPGSRRQPVARIFPRLLEGFLELKRRRPDARALVLHPGEAVRPLLEAALTRAGSAAEAVELRESGGTAEASAVLTSSGTMSLNVALAGIPGAIAYRANPLTYWIGRRLVKIRHLGIANLLLGREMHPEFLQGAATPTVLADALEAVLDDPERIERAEADAAELRALLRQPAGRSAGEWLAAQGERAERLFDL